MITRSDIENELIERAQIANNSVSLPSDRVTQVVKDASLWAGALHFWPSLLRLRYFSSKPSSQSALPILPIAYDIYDYPTDFLTGSISRLYIAGKKYDKKAYQDFVDYTDNAQQAQNPPDPNKHYFTEYGRQFFTWPGVSTAGTNDGLVWGNIQAPPLSDPTTKTIFSQWDDSGNEAILKKALSVVFERLDSGFASTQKAEAVALLQLIWNKVVAENQKSQRLNHPRFSVPNFFAHDSGISNIGNFFTNVEIQN